MAEPERIDEKEPSKDLGPDPTLPSLQSGDLISPLPMEDLRLPNQPELTDSVQQQRLEEGLSEVTTEAAGDNLQNDTQHPKRPLTPAQEQRRAYAKKLIREIGLTQTELSDLTGKAQSTFSQIMTDKQVPSRSLIIQLEKLRGDKKGQWPSARLANELETIPPENREQIDSQLVDYVKFLKSTLNIK